MSDDEDLDPIALDLVREINLQAKKQETKLKQEKTKWEREKHSNSSTGLARLRVLRGHREGIKSCQLCFNDTRVLTSSFDKTVKLWDISNGDIIRSFDGGHLHHISEARISPNNERFASAGWDKLMHMWDIESGKIMWSSEHQGIVSCCNISNDGKYAVSCSDLDNKIKIYDAKYGTLIHEIKDLHKSTVTSCQFSPKDDRLVTTSMDQTTKFWDMNSHKVTITLEGHSNVISSCAFSSDERRFATASWDKTIQIWDISTGMYRSEGPIALAKGHEGSVSSCAFSPDGLTLVSGSYDQSIVLWDVETGTLKVKLQGHEDWVEDVAFTKDQKWVISGSKDKTIRIWDVEDCDSMPVLMDNKKAAGLKVARCSKCGKPFSVTQSDGGDHNVCVFCRLQSNVQVNYFVVNNDE